MGLWGNRLRQHGGHHIRVPAWFQHQRAAGRIRMRAKPVAFADHRAPDRTWQAVDDESKGLTANVGVDGFHPCNHN